MYFGGDPTASIANFRIGLTLLMIDIFKLLSRWVHQDGWRGLGRKIRQVFLYWRFRLRVFFLRKLPKILVQAPLGKNTYWPDISNSVHPRSAASVPTFSILLPAYRTKPTWLREAVNSVRKQSYENWELCIGLYDVGTILQDEVRALSEKDSRVRVFDLSENSGISINCNLLAKNATGEFLAVLDHDDYIEPHALQELAPLVSSGQFDLIYTDEDVIFTGVKIPLPPNLKPDWSPDSLLSYNYICHFCCYRHNLFWEIGGFRSEYDGAQDYDLFLRFSEKTERIAHVPKVLYHWRRHALSSSSGSGAKPAAWEAGRRAVESHLKRVNEGARVELGKYFGTVRVHYPIPQAISVRIIIPSANRNNTLVRCLESIARFTRYPRYQVTVMLNGNGDFKELRKSYALHDRVFLHDYSEPFNYSRINNAAVAKSDGDVLVFMNDDIEVIEETWLEGLLEHVLRDKVGAVGPMLLYPNGTIQHSGISVEPDCIAWEFHKNLPQTTAGYNFRVQTLQNVTALTGACLCTRREYFLAVGGFDERLPLAYNDVDYCLKLLAMGYRMVYTPFVRLIHHESLTRGNDFEGEKWNRLRSEMDMMRQKWGAAGLRDRYFDPRLFKKGADLHRLAADYLSSPQL